RNDGRFRPARRIAIRFCVHGASLHTTGGVAKPRVLERGGTVRPSTDGPGWFLRAPDRLSRTGNWANPGGIDGRPPDRHGDRRTPRGRRVRVAPRSSPRDRAVAGEPSGGAVGDDTDDECCCPLPRLRDI